jgi:GT2 family glycosyltransferase
VEANAPAGRSTVSVVIPTCGRAVELERTLHSIFATGYEPIEIVVVENRPPSRRTRRVVAQEFAEQPVRYVEEPRRGGSSARNAGLAHTQGEIVAFTDDDVVVDRDWIRTFLHAFERNSNVACVTGRILQLSPPTALQKLFGDFSVFDKGAQLRTFRLPESRAELPLFPYVAGHVGSGANIIMRREVALNVGGFDPALGPGTPAVGGEDLDLFIRLVQDGFSIVYDPSVIVFHDDPDSVRELRGHAYRYGMGLTAMLTKHLLRGPHRFQLLRAIPAGVSYLLDPGSRKNIQKSSDYPKTLKALEYCGMVIGPLAYGASLAGALRHDRLSPQRSAPVLSAGSPGEP